MNCNDCKYLHDTGTALLCWGRRFAPPVDTDDWCAGWKPKIASPQTNADRVRSMTDEELAEWVWGAETSGRAYGPRGKKSWLRWLKAEVEE